MTMVDRLVALMDERNLKPAQITRELGISGSSFTDWKKGKGSPSLDVVVKFADYFNVSLDYIVRGVDFKDPNVDNSLEISNAREQKCLKIVSYTHLERCLINLGVSILVCKRVYNLCIL